MTNFRDSSRRGLAICLGIVAALGALYGIALLASADSGSMTPSSILLGGLGFILLVLSLLSARLRHQAMDGAKTRPVQLRLLPLPSLGSLKNPKNKGSQSEEGRVCAESCVCIRGTNHSLLDIFQGVARRIERSKEKAMNRRTTFSFRIDRSFNFCVCGAIYETGRRTAGFPAEPAAKVRRRLRPGSKHARDGP